MAANTHVVIPTHTTRHLRRTLLGYTAQTTPPDTITVSCDTDDPEIGALIERFVEEFEIELTYVFRAKQAEARPSQTRNNGVRSLLRRGLKEEDLLIFVDGDCIPSIDFIERHLEEASSADFVIGNYMLLDEETTKQIPTDDTMQSFLGTLSLDEQLVRLNVLERKARQHQFLRKFRLTKAHKPKILGANVSVWTRNVLAINGFDEEYIGWGHEDDDFARRLYCSGARSRIAITTAKVLHQWHPTRKNQIWNSGSAAQRFAAKHATRCIHGIDNPLPQSDVHERTFSMSGSVQR